MKRSPHVIRALTVLVGLLAAAALAAPAAAAHPEQPPSPFYNSVRGEDGCTLFETSGDAAWPAVHPPEEIHVAVSGVAVIRDASDGHPCLPVIPADRQIEFTGHVNDWAAVEHIVPMPLGSADLSYAFDLVAPGGAPIEYVTMRICQERRTDGSEWLGRCGPNIAIEQGAATSDHCTFTALMTSQWGTGYAMQVTITAIEPIQDWHAVIVFPSAQTLAQIWNATATASGSDLTISPAPWNRQIPAGSSATFGFLASGPPQPPPHLEVWADGSRCTEV
jgi:cellulase/cellobiase CelA1